jgi:hypothetical protein
MGRDGIQQSRYALLLAWKMEILQRKTKIDTDCPIQQWGRGGFK